ncbi:acyl-CoA dehydrogenase family protein [Fodinicola acaciae]|uniref:acyl-CoA dehydrogenase family protein n=1 Tax=Fodinicola acaciae TaxID=2681555 RepID=UPI0013D330CA|nr:acyl-CoA dehydrogenase family protein [Fodinicola acaciae]
MTDFRTRAAEWLAANKPPAIEGRSREDIVPMAKDFQAKLYDAGFAGITWPAAYGGQGLGQAELLAYNSVAKDYDLPDGPFIIGMGMCGPTILDLGTEEQKQRYVKPMLRGEEIWCQLFSEPGAGSDVASLQTKAVRDGDGWILNGQKVWTTNAQFADFGCVLARTNPDVPKHGGITMFIIDMHDPGVSVRPLRVMTGNAPFNEVFFTDVHIPGDNVLGAVNDGWRAAVTMLGHERVSIGTSVGPKSDPLAFSSLLETARRDGRDKDPAVRQTLAELYVHQRELQLLTIRMRQEAMAGKAIGARGSVAKLVGAQVANHGADVAGTVEGPTAVAWDSSDAAAAELATSVVGVPGIGIAGGTNEVQKNIIGERVLGLPKEPQVDRDVPFRELKVGTQRGE